MPTLARRSFPASIRFDLVAAADARQRQLASLPAPRGVVAEAHLRSVERILGDIRAALHRLDTCTYGDCQRCGDQLPLGVLVDLPWETRCEACAAL